MTQGDVRRPQQPGPRGLRFDVFATRVLYLVILGLGSISSAQIDLWWLLRAGQDIWRTGRVSLVERYSHTADGRYWSNHEWLWEAIAFALHHVGGMPLLTAWIGVTVAATVWVMRRCTPAEGYIVPIVLVLAIPLMSISWTARPQVTSMLFFALTMLLLARERYWWIPALFLVWANMHAQVVMGGALLAAALAAAAVDHVRTGSDSTRRRLRTVAAAAAVSAAATLCTPLGPRLWVYVLTANGRPGQSDISEWQNAFHPLVSNAMFWIVLVVAVVMSVLRRGRLSTWSSRVALLGAVAMAPLAVLAVRNIPFFLVAAMPLLMTVLAFGDVGRIGRVPRWRPALVAVGVLTAGAVGLVWWAQPPNLDWRPVTPGLASALRECPGPLYNDYNEGAPLIWWVPDVKVFVDNRQDPYPASVMDVSIDLDEEHYRRVFDDYDIKCALLPPALPLVEVLSRQGWTTSYEDRESVVLAAPSTPRATSATE